MNPSPPLNQRTQRPSGSWCHFWARSLSVIVLLFGSSVLGVEPLEVIIDCAQTSGPLRALHGGNNGPSGYGGIVDLTTEHRALKIPLTRLHDSSWPYPDLVDIHAVFPDFQADPARPASYQFGLTDDYLRAITNTGARIVYRLGESIEHAKRKRYVNPPADPERWAAICEGVIRHYNEGWADGLRLGIQYWEIWNEPENQPAMWTGTAEQFYRLYTTTAVRLKRRWPELKIGGPALGHQGEFREGRLIPSTFLRDFAAAVRTAGAPWDFFSWHLYTDDPGEPARRARAVRTWLDAGGWPRTESHLNEWNYLPGNDWTPMIQSQGAVREAWYARQGGTEGAAFAVGTLLALQAAPLDEANYYSADNQPFGLFSLHGAPKKTYHGFRMFADLLNTPQRVELRGSLPAKTFAVAGRNPAGSAVTLLISRMDGEPVPSRWTFAHLPWASASRATIRVLDSARELPVESVRESLATGAALELELRAPSVVLVELRPVSP